MIICVDSNLNENASDFGGQTIIKINKESEHKSLSSIIKINKENGFKHIITMNLWGFDKSDEWNEPIVIVSFPIEPKNYNYPPITISSNFLDFEHFKDTKIAKEFLLERGSKCLLLRRGRIFTTNLAKCIL